MCRVFVEDQCTPFQLPLAGISGLGDCTPKEERRAWARVMKRANGTINDLNYRSSVTRTRCWSTEDEGKAHSADETLSVLRGC